MIKQRINALRELMSKENISVYIVTSADYNQSAYVGGYFKLREFLTGFTGSNGTLVLTCDKAVLYTDSRYYLQAAQELLGSGIELFKAGEKETPEITDFITDNVPYGGTAAGDGRTFSASFADTLSLKLAKKNARLLYDCDLGGALWIEGRPEMPKEKAIIHDIKYAGVSAEEKIQWLRDEIKKLGADAHLITALDDIAWLLNIRGNDIHCLPAVLSYVFISQDELLLFVDADKITGAVKTHLLLLGVKVLPYDCIYDFLKNYNGSCKMLLLHRKKVNYRLCRAAMCRFDIIDRMNPTTLKKAIKNETEILNARR
ncbi:MAG: aminopeptidase P family N-terminal domain-containing protein, partial [Clostridia bacterium]|nr:aminopeptidase P family N-terminal domain-containing protein [Clostridia bacterium]